MVPQEDGYDPYRLPYWIRASFIMEERWGELEAEFNAGKAAMQLAEDWGVVSMAPSPAVRSRARTAPNRATLACSPSQYTVAGQQKHWGDCAGVLCCMLPCSLSPTALAGMMHSPILQCIQLRPAACCGP